MLSGRENKVDVQSSREPSLVPVSTKSFNSTILRFLPSGFLRAAYYRFHTSLMFLFRVFRRSELSTMSFGPRIGAPAKITRLLRRSYATT